MAWPRLRSTVGSQMVATAAMLLGEILMGSMELSEDGAPKGLYSWSAMVACGTLALALGWWSFLKDWRIGGSAEPPQRWVLPAAVGALLTTGAIAVYALVVHSAPAWMPLWLSELPRAGLVAALVVLVVPCRQVWRLRSG